MLYNFKLGHNITESTKNICCAAKGEGAVDHVTVTRWFKKFCSVCKNLNDQARVDKPKSMDSEAMFQTIETNLVSNTWRVSGELDISHSSMICHRHNFGKSILNLQTVPHITKIE